MATAVRWKYLSVNPTEGVKPPSVGRRTHNTWGPQQLGRFLEAARADRLYGLWVLVASTGMRRSELRGLQLPALNLDNRTVQMTTTRVVAGGRRAKEAGRALAVGGCWHWTGSRPRC
jgi:integrase